MKLNLDWLQDTPFHSTWRSQCSQSFLWRSEPEFLGFFKRTFININYR